MTNHFNNAAHTNGYEAAYEGRQLTDNPFSPETDAGKAWSHGWEQANSNQRDSARMDWSE